MEELKRESAFIDDIGRWLNLRREHVTASRVGALFDAHPFLTREQLSSELRGISTKGDTPAMRRGRILEPAVAAALQEEHPDWVLTKANTYHWLPEHRLGCTPDYYLGETGLVECKTVNPAKWDEWHYRPPLAYTLQLLTGLLCTNRTHGILAVMVLSPDFPVYEFDVGRHPAAEQRILEATAEWWRAYEAGELPGAAPLGDLESVLDDGTVIDLSTDPAIRDLLDKHLRLSSAMSDLRKQQGHIDHQIKTRIGKARAAYVPGYAVSFATSYRKGYSVAPCEVRTLRIKTINEDMLDE